MHNIKQIPLLIALVSLPLVACQQKDSEPTVPPATPGEVAAASQLDRGELSDGLAVPHFDDDGYYEMIERVALRPVGDDRPQYAEVELMIEPTLAAACGMPAPKVRFETDSARVAPSKKNTLADLADCLTEHPLDDDLLEITGHADPRGSEEYNRELGLDRANAVARVLQTHGVSSSRIDTYSVGEAKASEEPEQWALDRKVVIRLDR